MRPAAPVSPLTVDISALRRRQVHHHRVVTPLDEALFGQALKDTDAEFGSPGEISLDLVIQGDGSVVATGKIQVQFTVACARCLEPAQVDGTTSIAALFVPDLPQRTAARARDEQEDEEEDGGPDEDLWPFDGIILDLRPMVHEYLRLAYPMRALCSRQEACRGLCSGCGASLNEQPPQAAACARCGRVDPAVPIVDEIPEVSTAGPSALAEALGKIRLPE